VICYARSVSDPADRRANPRFECELKTYVLNVRGDMLSGTSADLSRGGVSVELVEPVAVGEAVQIYLRLVLGWTAADFLTLPGRVVRCERIAEGHRIGVELEPLSETQGERLELLIRVLAGELDAVLEATGG
jgi:hypothetical protein